MNLFQLLFASALSEGQKDSCYMSADKTICNSVSCPDHTWCEICDACLLTEDAVTKDEL